MTKLISAVDIAALIESWAPKSLAYDWDSVGLQVGTLNKQVSKVLVTLDVTESVVNEAIEKDIDMIIAHHPLFFKPLKQLDINSRRGKIIEKLLLNHITVYAAHTNLDSAEGGVSDMLADLLDLKNISVLSEDRTKQLIKLAIYVPESHAEVLREALGNAGAGHIGDYSHCSFAYKGQGSFKPEEGSNPYLGTLDTMERVDEVKIETIIAEENIAAMITVLKEVHPYEEPAYDLIPLYNKGKAVGVGRVGELSNWLSIDELCKLIKEKWELSHLRVSGNMTEQVKRVAILGGSGEGYIAAAKSKEADVYITGDLTFHHSQDAWLEGLNLIDAGHYAEKVMKRGVKKYLDSQFDEKSSLEVLISTVNTNPFQYY